MYIGLDVGTQSLKAAVVADDMRVLGTGAVPYEVDHPQPGWAEQDPLLWERAIGPAIARALQVAGRRPGEVRALGISGQLDGCVAVGGDGQPLAPCLIWMDRRAIECMPELPADFQARTGIHPDPGHMAAKIVWLSRSDPPIAPRRFHQPVSYLVARLTGASVMDPAHASTTMLFELGATVADPDLCQLFGVDPSWLPNIAAADSPAGSLAAVGAVLTGLPAGIPVAVGTGDDFATPLGAGITGPGPLAVVLGTAEVTGALHPDPVVDLGGLVETHAFPAGGYFVENPGWLAGGAIAWAREVFGFADDAELDAAAASVAPGCDGLLFLPALSGAMAPRWNPELRGCFYGLTPSHRREHHARAVLEACALANRDVQLALSRLGVAADRVVALGGGARSDVWLQIRADVSGLDVARAPHAECAALGAALLAASAHEGTPVAELAVQIRDPEPVARPRAHEHQVYADAHARYLDLFAALDRL